MSSCSSVPEEISTSQPQEMEKQEEPEVPSVDTKCEEQKNKEAERLKLEKALKQQMASVKRTASEVSFCEMELKNVQKQLHECQGSSDKKEAKDLLHLKEACYSALHRVERRFRGLKSQLVETVTALEKESPRDPLVLAARELLCHLSQQRTLKQSISAVKRARNEIVFCHDALNDIRKQILACQQDKDSDELARLLKLRKDAEVSVRNVERRVKDLKAKLALALRDLERNLPNDPLVAEAREVLGQMERQNALMFTVGSVKRTRNEVTFCHDAIKELQSQIDTSEFEKESQEMTKLLNMKQEGEAALKNVENRLNGLKTKLISCIKDVKKEFPDDPYVIEGELLLNQLQKRHVLKFNVGSLHRRMNEIEFCRSDLNEVIEQIAALANDKDNPELQKLIKQREGGETALLSVEKRIKDLKGNLPGYISDVEGEFPDDPYVIDGKNLLSQ